MPGAEDEQILTARWVFPATSPPLAGGTVTVRGDRIRVQAGVALRTR